MTTPELPPCGLYRTVAAIGGVEADRLVYFHNHGDPGPGVYLPERWTRNRATFSSRGNTLDGRLKPTIVTPGLNVTSASGASDTGYHLLSGTSMATPICASSWRSTSSVATTTPRWRWSRAA